LIDWDRFSCRPVIPVVVHIGRSMLRFAWIFCWFVAAPLAALILIAAALFSHWLVLHDHRTGGPRSSGSLTDMIRSIGSRLVSPGRWLAAMHDHQARKLPIFCISAYG
jgi:hypothetical protein